MNTVKQKFRRSILYPLVYGCLTGVLCGAAGALLFVCARIVCTFAFGLYGGGDGALATVCIVILTLLCCLLTAVIQMLAPSARGSGIPLAEGCARGILRVKWLRTAAALIAGSILSFLCGMPLGSEGPSVGIGGLIGEGVGKIAKKPVEFRRYLITGGSSAGLAAAFNAPLMGICLAIEEMHKKITPYIFAATLSAVIAAVATTQAILFGLGHIPYLDAIGVGAGGAALRSLEQAPMSNWLDALKLTAIAAACGVACGALGAAFNRLIFVFGKLFGKIRNKILRLLPAFALACAVGLAFPLAVGSGEQTLAHSSTQTALWLLCVLLALRLLTTVAASGSGATGGLFLPMIAIGGLFGLIMAKLCIACGMDARFANNITVLCICAFFAATVRAPITAVVMSAELTASFVNLLPCVVAVAVAALVARALRTAPLYEAMLENLAERIEAKERTVTVVGTVRASSTVAFKSVKDVLWPHNSIITELKRGDAALVPDDETTLVPNDKIIIRAENVDESDFIELVKEYIDVSDAEDIP